LKYRLFAALELPLDLQARLAEVQAAFQAQLPPRVVRWVRPDGIHLTLKFYGHVHAERAPELRLGLERAAQLAGAAALTTPLTLRGLGVFPNPARPQVVWVGLEGDLGPLHRLQQVLEAEAEAQGFPPEARPFAPHLTLGRVRSRLSIPDQEAFLAFLRQAHLDALGQFRPAALSLMASDRRPMGAVYSQLYVVPFANKESASGTA
jgi:2'-5' RNA ligase